MEIDFSKITEKYDPILDACSDDEVKSFQRGMKCGIEMMLEIVYMLIPDCCDKNESDWNKVLYTLDHLNLKTGVWEDGFEPPDF